jgi:hypothetical protein
MREGPAFVQLVAALCLAVAVAAVGLPACAPTIVQTRRVIVPIGTDGGERCFRECMASSFCGLGRSCVAAQFACLETCPYARVEAGPCAGADLRSNERCWTNLGRF